MSCVRMSRSKTNSDESNVGVSHNDKTSAASLYRLVRESALPSAVSSANLFGVELAESETQPEAHELELVELRGP